MQKAADGDKSRILYGVYLLVGVTIVIIILVCILAIFVTKRLLLSIGAEPTEMEDIARRVAEGDLTIKLQSGKSGIYEEMRRMVESLRLVMDRVNQSAQEVSVAPCNCIEEGVVEVERGTTGASRSGKALETILEQINKVTGQVNQIATAAEEQTATTREITNNIHNISKTVQSSAQSSQEMSQSSSRLSQLSVDLQDLVRRFRL